MQRARGTVEAWVRGYALRPVRRSIAHGGARWARWLPGEVRRRFDLDGTEVRPLRIEIGSGPFPTPGYVHVDADWRARHLEHVAPAWNLPFETGSVQEILAVHVLEHVHPVTAERTLREWLRVLRPGGMAQIHVPNARQVLPAYLDGDSRLKYAAMAAIYGMPCDPGITDPGTVELRRRWPEHQAMYDFELLREVLEAAGFERVVDVSKECSDRHTQGWEAFDLISALSLIVRAWAPAA